MPIRFRRPSGPETASGTQSTTRFESPLLPFDVRYGLKYREGHIKGSEALSLIECLPHLALYAAAKINDPNAHKVLPDLLTEFLFGRDREAALAKALSEQRDSLVKLSKLSQINVRMDVWSQLLGQMSERVGSDQVPFLYAYSTLTGVEAFANSYQLPFGIVIPPNEEDGWRGIWVDVPDRVVSEVFTLDGLPSNSLVIDDTLATGQHRDSLMDAIGRQDTEFTVLIDRSAAFVDQRPTD